MVLIFRVIYHLFLFQIFICQETQGMALCSGPIEEIAHSNIDFLVFAAPDKNAKAQKEWCQMFLHVYQELCNSLSIQVPVS